MIAHDAHNIVAWGMQQYFLEHYKKIIPGLLITHAYDELSSTPPFGIKKIANVDEIRSLAGNTLILICRYGEQDIKEIAKHLEALNLPYDHLGFHIEKSIPIHILRAMGRFNYQDSRGNKIILDKGATGNITIGLRGKNSVIRIGKISASQNLSVIASGDYCELSIGDHSTFVKCYIEIGSHGTVTIGKDCMFSYEIALHQSDQHLIFDLDSKKRINNPKNITIGNHVWVGRKAMLLGGFAIGNGSIIGACSVSSSQFSRNMIIAGSPAKTVREKILWSRDLVSESLSDDFNECIDRSADKYL